MVFNSGEGEVGIENGGLNHSGMNFVKDKAYEGHVWVRAERAVKLFARLQSGDGSKTYAEQSLDVSAGDWQRIGLALKPNNTDARGRLCLCLREPGSGVFRLCISPAR